MAEDIESDFWKDHLTHLQHKNMVRINAERLNFSEVPAAIKAFNEKYAAFNPIVEDAGSYIIWEVFITDSIKLRLYFQYQIKGSLMQKKDGDFVKICDAKFPYNPFPEVGEFLDRRDSYLKELAAEKKDAVHANMQAKISGEFIKAKFSKMTAELSGLIWKLEPQNNCHKLEVEYKGQKDAFEISFENFLDDLKTAVTKVNSYK